MFNMSKAVKTTRVSNAVAAGTTDIESTAVDTKGLGAVQFEVAFGAITAGAVTNIHVEGSDDNVTFADLAGTAVAVADDDDNQIFGIDVIEPVHRYVRCVVDRATQNAVVDSIVAHQYLADKEPVTQPATTTIETHVAPVAGTA